MRDKQGCSSAWAGACKLGSKLCRAPRQPMRTIGPQAAYLRRNLVAGHVLCGRPHLPELLRSHVLQMGACGMCQRL